MEEDAVFGELVCYQGNLQQLVFCEVKAFLLKRTMKGCYEKSGAQATAVKPHRKKMNIHFE